MGCGRTLEQIKKWRYYSVEDRARIMNQLNRGTKCPECGAPNRCAVAEGKSPEACWCMGLVPPQSVVDRLTEEGDEGNECWCRTCLRGEKR